MGNAASMILNNTYPIVKKIAIKWNIYTVSPVVTTVPIYAVSSLRTHSIKI